MVSVRTKMVDVERRSQPGRGVYKAAVSLGSDRGAGRVALRSSRVVQFEELQLFVQGSRAPGTRCLNKQRGRGSGA